MEIAAAILVVLFIVLAAWVLWRRNPRPDNPEPFDHGSP
jgi:hypothetical protein